MDNLTRSEKEVITLALGMLKLSLVKERMKKQEKHTEMKFEKTAEELYEESYEIYQKIVLELEKETIGGNY